MKVNKATNERILQKALANKAIIRRNNEERDNVLCTSDKKKRNFVTTGKIDGKRG